MFLTPLGPRRPIEPYEAFCAILDLFNLYLGFKLLLLIVVEPFLSAVLEWIHPIGRFR